MKHTEEGSSRVRIPKENCAGQSKTRRHAPQSQTEDQQHTQGMTQPISSDDTGGDPVMEGETADEGGAGDSNPSGPDSRRRITTKREPWEARDERATVTGQHVPRRMSGKTTPQVHAVAVTTQEALDGSREKTM